MKIVHVNWEMNIGGAESIIVDIINEQSRKKEVHLIIVNRPESIQLTDKINKSVIIHRIGRKPGSRNVFIILFANLMLLQLRPDIVHFHHQDLIPFFPFAKWRCAKLLLTLHHIGTPVKNLHRYDRVFAISDTVNRDIQDRSKILPVTVDNGIPTNSIRKKNDFNRLHFKIVQVGRLDHQVKGQDILLKAIDHLVNKKNTKNISVDFIGEGPSAEYLKEISRRMNIKDFCNFIGTKDREWVYEHLCEYDLLVQPSRSEGFGLTVAEGLAAKLPILVSNLDAPMEIIGNGKYGYHFTSENSNDLAEKILLIQKEYSSKILQEKIEAGYLHVIDSYDVKRTASNYLNHYKD